MSQRHWFGPYKSGTTEGQYTRGEGHPLLFSFKECDHFDPFPEGGGYPKRFLAFAYEVLGVIDPDAVLHMCSGSMNRGIRVDVRPETNPTIVADARRMPFSDNTFQWILCDPPYSAEYARNLYGTEAVYPTPLSLVKEACRVLQPGGRFGFLHFQVPMFRKPLKLVNTYGITTGLGNAIRALTVFEKMAEKGEAAA